MKHTLTFGLIKTSVYYQSYRLLKIQQFSGKSPGRIKNQEIYVELIFRHDSKTELGN